MKNLTAKAPRRKEVVTARQSLDFAFSAAPRRCGSISLYCLLIFLPLISSCSRVADQKDTPVAISLLGKSYFEPERSVEAQAKLDSNLAVARTNWMSDPSEDSYIWYGRRLGYLSRFQEAIDIFTQGIEKYPNSAKLYRHRGHRFISIRQFDNAIKDLTAADTLIAGFPTEVEPDGMPNKINTPLSTTQFNILYHLGLVYYLKGDFANAQHAYLECLKSSNNNDLLVATIDWLYMTYRRQSKDLEAKFLLDNITDSIEVIENGSYFNRCRMYQGKILPDALLHVASDEQDADLALATQGYGVGNWYMYNGDSTKAKEVFEKVVAGKYFSAFGFIAAEAELARWEK